MSELLDTYTMGNLPGYTSIATIICKLQHVYTSSLPAPKILTKASTMSTLLYVQRNLSKKTPFYLQLNPQFPVKGSDIDSPSRV